MMFCFDFVVGIIHYSINANYETIVIKKKTSCLLLNC